MAAAAWSTQHDDSGVAAPTLFLRERTPAAAHSACDWIRDGGSVLISGDDALLVAEALRHFPDAPTGLRIRMIGEEILVYLDPPL